MNILLKASALFAGIVFLVALGLPWAVLLKDLLLSGPASAGMVTQGLVHAYWDWCDRVIWRVFKVKVR